MESKYILTPVAIEDLLQELRGIIREEIKAKQSEEIEARLQSPASTCKLFSPPISKVTLAAWTKAGYLKDYRIAGRIYYKTSEVIEAAKHLKKYNKTM